MDWYLEVRIQARDRRYSFCLLIPEIKGTKILKRLTWMYHVVHNQDAVYLVDIDLAIRKGLTFYQTRSNAIILQGTLPAYCIRKSCQIEDWRSLVWESTHMSPRPPPKISSRHDWATGEVAQQPRGEVSRQAKFFQPTQLIPKPICDRSGQPDNKHEVFVDKGETSWSRKIKETSFHEELCSSDRSGQPDITPCVINAQTTLSGEIRVEQTHDRSGQPDKHEIVLQAAPEVHREITTLNTDNVKELRRTWTSEFQDCHIQLWSKRKVPAFENWFRKLRTTQIDMLFNKIYDKVNHLTLSVQNRSKWFRLWVRSNCVNCSRRNRRRSAQCVYHTGTLVYSTAREGTSSTTKQRSIENSLTTQWIFFQSLSMSLRREDLMDIDMGKSQETKNIIWLTNWRRNTWPIPTRSRTQHSNDWKSSRWRSLSTMGCSCGWRSHSPFDSIRILPL